MMWKLQQKEMKLLKNVQSFKKKRKTKYSENSLRCSPNKKQLRISQSSVSLKSL